MEPPLVWADEADDFEGLALLIAEFQARHCEGFRRLVERSGHHLDRIDHIPAVTVDTFRYCRVACHPEELDTHVFVTSGTTGRAAGRHPVRNADTYAALAIALARRTLFADAPKAIVVALAENPGSPSPSSLGLMMQLFMRHFDGEALLRDPRGAAFDPNDPARWLIQSGLVDTKGLRRAAEIAKQRARPLVLLSTGFALAAALEALDGERLKTPKGTTLMLTGGMKGRRTTLREEDLKPRAAEALGIDEARIVSEYGMTELTSQLYESPRSPPKTARDPQQVSRGGYWPPVLPPGLYSPPPWLRVWPVDPQTGERTAPGTPGLAQFCDLGNVDSAVVVRTEDRIVLEGEGVRLLGRSTGAPPRGCSLPFEGLLSARLTR
jgi:hypothetical protein